MRARLYLHIGLCCALFAVFLVLSMPIVGPAILENKIGPIDPSHSTDSYLSAKLHRTYNIIAATSFLHVMPAAWLAIGLASSPPKAQFETLEFKLV